MLWVVRKSSFFALGMCGKSSLKKLRTEGGWGSMPPASLEPLEQALTILEEDLKSKKEEKKDMHRAWTALGRTWRSQVD